jgi:hypothetical protein
MPEPDFRTLEQRLIARLFPQSNPKKEFAKAYGVASVGDLIILNRLNTDLLERVKRTCDLNPAGAPDLIRLIADIFDEGFEYGRDDAVNELSDEWEERGVQKERDRVRTELGKVVGGWTV